MCWSRFDRTRQVWVLDFAAADYSGLPNIITFAVRLSVAHKTSTCLVQIRVAVRAFETACVPLQVGCYAENVLVLNLRSAADTHRYSTLLCKRNTKQNLRAPWSKSVTGNTLWVQESRGAGRRFILTSREIASGEPRTLKFLIAHSRGSFRIHSWWYQPKWDY